MKTDQSEWVSRAGKSALVASVLTILLIAYGSWVRVSGSGLGCPDWPLCEGNVIPELQGDVAIEFGHRFLAGITMILVIVTSFFAYKGRTEDMLTAKLIFLALSAIFIQAILGGITVLTELHGMVRLAHLTFAMLTLGLLVSGAARSLNIKGISMPTPKRARAMIIATLFVVLAGGLIVGSGESSGCPGLPLCDSRSSNAALLFHSLHRIAATLLVFVFVWTAFQVRKNGAKGFTWIISLVIASLALLQFSVGISAIVTDLPQSLRVIHLALAATIWSFVVAQFNLSLKGESQK
ncbi:MAG: COX15/CtaA family protein [Dehalococcoidia bacterium]|jgi:heme A synthase|nr:COX15/CtaA family protein [Dehalococcoidia bacterium]|tara:strand:- start:717 stop:1598 length:882 start_codon:yes stop_codon:yes gene_type:complete